MDSLKEPSHGLHFYPLIATEETELVVYGFRNLPLNGACDFFYTCIAFIPTVGKLIYTCEDDRSSYEDISSGFGYWKCKHKKTGIESELTGTKRTGITDIQYPAEHYNLIIELSKMAGETHASTSSIKIANEYEIEGSMYTGFKCEKEPSHALYYVIQLNKKALNKTFFNEAKDLKKNEVQLWEKKIALGLSFEASGKDALRVRIGISNKSVADARKNIKTEQRNLTISKMRRNANLRWKFETDQIMSK